MTGLRRSKGMITARAVSAAVLVAALAACGGSGAPEVDDTPLEPEVVETGPDASADEAAPTHAPAPVYVGVWAARAEWCGRAPGSSDAAPVAFTEAAFIGYENRCVIAEAQEGTEGGYLMTLACSGDGGDYRETVEIDVGGDRLRLTREGGESQFVRCPRETGDD